MASERKYKNLPPGSVFNSWTIIKYEGFISGEDKYVVKCVCGKERIRSGRDIVNGRSKSCGCTRLVPEEVKRERRKKYKAEWFLRNKERLQLKHVEEQREQRLKDIEMYGTDRYSLKYHYGLSLEEFSDMLSAQDNRCAICGRGFVYEKNNRLRPVVDHDHSTGVIRGVLCNSCNMAIGLLQDDKLIIRNAAKYLEEYEDGGKKISNDKTS